MEFIQANLHYSVHYGGQVYSLKEGKYGAEWLKNLLADIPLWTRPALSVFMLCDSQVAIAKDKSKMFNEKNMHKCLRHNIV